MDLLMNQSFVFFQNNNKTMNEPKHKSDNLQVINKLRLHATTVYLSNDLNFILFRNKLR